MFVARLFKWLIILLALAAVIAFLPINGRSVLQRWQAARSPEAFFSGSWQELKAEFDWLFEHESDPHHRGGQRVARAPKPSTTRGATPAGQPAEHHTAADRKALDAIVAEHVK